MRLFKLCMVSMAIALILAACSGLVKHDAQLAASIQAMMTDKSLSTDCKAGIMNGFTIAPETTADIRLTVQAINAVANRDSQDFKDCFAKSVWFEFLIHGGEAEISKATPLFHLLLNAVK